MYKCCKLYVHIKKPKEISIKILDLYLNLTSSVMFLRLICTARYHVFKVDMYCTVPYLFPASDGQNRHFRAPLGVV